MLNGNIFRRAQLLLRDKPALEMTGEEQAVVSIATMPLLLLPQFNDILIDDGLEWLAQVYDEANMVAEPRGRVEVTHEPHELGTVVRIHPPLPKITASQESISLLTGRR